MSNHKTEDKFYDEGCPGNHCLCAESREKLMKEEAAKAAKAASEGKELQPDPAVDKEKQRLLTNHTPMYLLFIREFADGFYIVNGHGEKLTLLPMGFVQRNGNEFTLHYQREFEPFVNQLHELFEQGMKAEQANGSSEGVYRAHHVHDENCGCGHHDDHDHHHHH